MKFLSCLILSSMEWVNPTDATKASKNTKTTSPSSQPSSQPSSSPNSKDVFIPFDLYGNPSVFQPSEFINIDSNCEYTAVIEANIRDAGLNVPNPPTDCSPTVMNCVDQKGEVMSCLNEQRNLFDLSEEFTTHTGFDHLGLDYSPCGHPPVGIFTKSHVNFHYFRRTPHERRIATCTMVPGAPICDFPGNGSPSPVQTTPSGHAYFVRSVDFESGLIANLPSTYTPALDTAVPGEGVHAWDHSKVSDQNNWTEPILIMGTYDGSISFWEPMSPLFFHIGNESNLYEEYVTYAAQTIVELPSYFSVAYDAPSGLTTVTIKGTSAVCKPKSLLP